MAREVICPQCGTQLRIEMPLEPPRSVPASPVRGDSKALLQPQPQQGAEFPPLSNSDDVPTPIPPAQEEVAWLDPAPGLASTKARPVPTPTQSEPKPTASSVGASARRKAVRKMSWGDVMVRTYASLATVACVWLWWAGHSHKPDASALDVAGAEDQVFASQRAGQSRTVNPTTAIIPPDNYVNINRGLRIGSIEFTPVSISRGPVELESTAKDRAKETKAGGKDALILHVKIKNLSPDGVFAPLDEAFVRKPKDGLPHSFLESEDGSRIYLYDLPVEKSEWSIVGQDFREISPGETLETDVVSVASAPSRLPSHFTWRLRLRTGSGANQTELVGVHLQPSQVK